MPAMKLLHPDIQAFIDELRVLGEIGCLRVPESGLSPLIEALERASVIVGRTPAPGRVTYLQVTPESDLAAVAPPALLVVTEEEFADASFAERLRARAAYFKRVAGS